MSTAMLVSSQPTAQQLVDFANAVAVVNNYAYAVTNQTLPVLQYPPEDYGTFAAKFAPAKQHCLNWTDNTFVAMLQLPVTIKEQGADMFALEGTMIDSALTILVSDPSNAQAKELLSTSLTALQSVIAGQIKTADDIEAALLQFATDVTTDATTLAGIAALATQDAGDDQGHIVDAQHDIAALQRQIQTAQTLLTVSEIGLGLSIFVGIIGVVCCFIPGAQGLGVGLIVGAVGGLAGSIAGTVIESEAIKAMQGQIDSDQKQITGLHQDIILLNGIAAQFTSLSQAGTKAAEALATIKTTWSGLDQVINDVKNELTDVGADVTAAQYQQAKTDFATAEQNWADVVEYAKALAGIDYKWQDASGEWHSFGQSAPESDAGKVSQIPTTIQAA